MPTGLPQTREVLQIGAELYGDASVAADREVLAAAAVFARCGRRAAACTSISGHVGVYRALANGAHIAGNGDDSELFAALRTKDVPGDRPN